MALVNKKQLAPLLVELNTSQSFATYKITSAGKRVNGLSMQQVFAAQTRCIQVKTSVNCKTKWRLEDMCAPSQSILRELKNGHS